MTTTIRKPRGISAAEWKLNIEAQELDARNSQFKLMSPAEKRVAIAKDVLTWLAVGKILPKTGTYLSSEAWVNNYSVLKDMKVEDDRVDGGACTACALGAVFACAVEREGGVQNFWRYGSSQQHMHQHLTPYFDTWQLKAIETAFERSDFLSTADEAKASEAWGIDNQTGPFTTPSPVVKAAAEFADNCNSAAKRMEAIMKNIIANDGMFNPVKGPRP